MPPLLLLPGLLCTQAIWEPVQARLRPDIETIAVAPGRRDSIAAMAADVLAAAPPTFCLAGHSMGGYVALEIMRRAPERVAGLALMSTSARPDSPEHTRRRLDFIALTERGQFRGVTPRLFPVLVAESKREDKALFDLIQAMAAEIGPADFVAQQKAIMGRADSRPTLAEINCPSLVLCGGQDELTPPELSLELYRGIGNSELHILAGIGHMAPLEHPDLVAALLERMLVERL